MDWKENLNLFCNDVFQYKHFNGEIDFVWKDLSLLRWLKEHQPEYFQKCQLIARRIESMTDEEIKVFNSFFGEEKVVDETHTTWFIGEYKPFLYLLSIGVYPFEWNETILEDGK